MHPINKPHDVAHTIIAPLCFVFLVLGIQIAVILIRNDGIFSYILDDAYIHMALAEQIANGHYGINAGEYASPSSSILWPFLLAPFAHTSFFEWVPLLINMISVGLSIAVLRHMIKLLIPSHDRYARFLYIMLPLLSIILLNMHWLMATGMEHSLQVLLTLCVVTGAIHIQQRKAIPWWFIAGIVIGPLVRYENMSVSLAGLIILYIQGYRLYAGLLGVIILAALASFTAFLLALDLPILPSSILSKAGMRDGQGIITNILIQFLHLLGKIAAFPMGVLLLFILSYSIKKLPTTNYKILAAMAIMVIVAHFLFGPSGFYFRYERYLIAVFLPILFLLASQTLTVALEYKGKWPVSTLILLLLITYVVPTNIAYGIIGVPQGSYNIYSQQYQMRRFAQKFYTSPIAINDLGWVAYRHKAYVLDFLGLASEAARKRRFEKNREWMDDLVKDHNVGLVMIYESGFKRNIPTSWQKVATMRITDELVTPAIDKVTFFITNKERSTEALTALRAFAPTLPKNVAFEIIEPLPLIGEERLY